MFAIPEHEYIESSYSVDLALSFQSVGGLLGTQDGFLNKDIFIAVHYCVYAQYKHMYNH